MKLSYNLKIFKTFAVSSAKVFALVMVMLFSLPAIGNAQTSSSASSDSNALTKVLCNVYKITTGKAGKTFAAFAVISAGVGFFTGKLQWGLLIALVLGISAIFGAPSIVSAITNDAQPTCGTELVTVS